MRHVRNRLKDGVGEARLLFVGQGIGQGSTLHSNWYNNNNSNYYS